MASRIPSSAQPLATQTLTTTTAGASIDTSKYDYSLFAVELNFAGGTSSIAQIEISDDDSTYVVDLARVTPATTGTGVYTHIVSCAKRYFRVKLSTVGGATLTAKILPIA